MCVCEQTSVCWYEKYKIKFLIIVRLGADVKQKKMKKIFVLLVVLIGFGINALPQPTNVQNAQCVSGNFSCKENGKTIAKISLKNDCTYTMYNYEEGTSIGGKYSISDYLTPGGTVYLTFVMNGQNYSGTMMYPLQGKIGISFDGLYFELEGF